MYTPKLWTPRPPASGLYRPGRAFDGYPAHALDSASAGAGSYAFLLAQLALIDPKIVEPLQAVTHTRDVPIKTGGGFPTDITAFATNYATSGPNSLGVQGTSNTELPLVQADVNQGSWKVLTWAHGMVITAMDLARLDTAKRSGMPPPISLEDLYRNGIQTVWLKALDYNTYLGFNGLPGLCNNSAVPEIVALTVGGYTAWSTKTPTQILNDFNYALNTTMANSGYDAARGMPNHCLIPWTQWGLLSQPMTTAGTESTISYIERNCVARASGQPFKIDHLPNPWISGQGAGSPATDRAVFYRNDNENLELYIPTVMQKTMTVPTTRSGGAYETTYNGCFSQLAFKRTTTMCYMDGV